MNNRHNDTTAVKSKRILTTILAGFIAFAGFTASAPQAAAEAPYDSLFLIGDASPNGWSISNPTPMVQDSENDWVFVYEGILYPGEFKISTFTGDWCDGDWLLAPSQHPELEDEDITGYTVFEGCPPEEEDFKWLIDRDGISEYKLTVNLQDETIEIIYQGAYEPAYEQIYILGSALPVGWNIGNPTPMDRHDTRIWEFTFEGFLMPGDFKISTFTGDWCDGDWIRPPSMHPPLSDTEFIITTGCPDEADDFTWRITTEDVGDYRIYVNLMDETIRIELVDGDAPPFEVLYLVGDATPGGWSLDEQTPMDRNPDNPFLFNWSGDLVAGEFKIKTYSDNDFCGDDWIHPLVEGPSFSDTRYEVLEGCGPHDDYKWVVSEEQAGHFDITVDTENESISITGENVETSAGYPEANVPMAYRLGQNYPNPFNPATRIEYSVSENTEVTIRVYDVVGRHVATLAQGVHAPGTYAATFDASALAGGLYIYRMEAGSFKQTRKMMLIK